MPATPWVFAGAALAGCAVVGLTGAHNPLLPVCPFKEVTGLDCPGCGLTRGVRQLVTGHPLAALDHNVLLVAIVPFVVWAWLAWAGLVTRHLPPRVGGRRAWALRRLPGRLRGRAEPAVPGLPLVELRRARRVASDGAARATGASPLS